MKRYALALFILASWLFLVGSAAIQPPAQDGFPPQTALFNDAQFLARVIPFLIGLAIIAGILQARADAVHGGDALLGEKVRRHDTSSIIAHWMNAFGLILGFITGAMVLRWTGRAVELRQVFILHYFGAALALFGIFNHLARHGVSGGTGLIPKKLSVIRDMIGELFEYIGLYGPEGAVLRIPWPKAIRQPIARYVTALLGYKPHLHGKYLATEQTLSYPVWAVLIGSIVLTGLIKTMRYTFEIPKSTLETATTLHDVTAIAIGVMLIIHLLPLLLIPANWPLLLSMFKTTVPRKYVQERHPLWYKKLQADEKSKAPVSETSSEPLPVQTASVPSGD